MLNFHLTDDQLALRDRARRFAISHVLPVAWYFDEKDEVPVQVLEKALDSGLMNADIPKAYGGQGVGLVDATIVTEEMAAACPGIATSIFDSSLGMTPLILCDNEALKRRIFSRVLVEGSRVGFATSEPTMGSDVAGIRCEAKDAGDHYLITGTKYWITNGAVSDFMSVFATVDPKAGHAGIGAFLVDMQCKGITVGKTIPKMGQRCSNTVGIHFDRVKVPKANVLAEPGKGFHLAMKTFDRTRPIIGAFAVGAARSAMEYALDYAKKRRAFGSPLAGFQAIQFKLAEMYQKVETARLLTLKAKMFPVEKLMRDIRLLRIYEGTSEIQRLIVSGWLLTHYEPAMPSMDTLPIHRDVNPEINRDGNAFRCRLCGYIHYGEEAPESCPTCFFPATSFKEV